MGGFTKPNGFVITNPRSDTLQHKFLKIQKPNNLGSTAKEKNQEITYLLELPTKGDDESRHASPQEQDHN